MNMGKLKCNDCDQVFDESMDHCPNCGCPASDCQHIVVDDETTDQQPYARDYVEGSFATTDTGVKYEKTIKTYANVIWVLCIVLSVIYGVGVLVLMIQNARYIGGGVLLYLFISLIGIALFLLLVYVFRAFIMVLHNISINVHEINMKIK